MKIHLALALVSAAFAQSSEPLAAARMTMNPDQIFHDLRDKTPVIPASDCDAIGLWACREASVPVDDISLRWVQLDEDAEMEAVIVVQERPSYIGFAFDKQGTWFMVGRFDCYRTCDLPHFMQVQNLPFASPPLLLNHRDLGGSGSVTLVTTGYRLRGGKLWPAFEALIYERVPFANPYVIRKVVLVLLC